mmetsp:Transcript_10634/g.44128  ORF Transcript_10634/g.44128 Transcript_10634/m.44128 type:complete len:256 (-) Transcript_10634:381-1148(-)
MASTLACDLYSSLLPSKGLAATAHRVSVSNSASLSRDPGWTTTSTSTSSSSDSRSDVDVGRVTLVTLGVTLPEAGGSAVSPARANVSLITRTSARRAAVRSRSAAAATARCSVDRHSCASASPLTAQPSDACAARTHATHATCVDETFTSAHLATLMTREESARSRSMSSADGVGSADGAGDDDDGSGEASWTFGAHPSVAPWTSPVANRSLRPSSAGSHSFEVLLSQARRNTRVAISTSSALIAPASAPASASC